MGHRKNKYISFAQICKRDQTQTDATQQHEPGKADFPIYTVLVSFVNSTQVLSQIVLHTSLNQK